MNNLKIYQNSCQITRSYEIRLREKIKGIKEFKSAIDIFKDDLYGINHLLKPIADGETNCFYSNRNNYDLQKRWAADHQLKYKKIDEIFFAQLEEYKIEIFYDLDPKKDSYKILKKFPSNVKYKIAWRAAPINSNLECYDLIVNNFENILNQYRNDGCNVGYLTPSYSPEIEKFQKKNRDYNVFFSGTHSRHHLDRNRFLIDLVKSLDSKILLHLEKSLITNIATSKYINKIPYIKKFSIDRFLLNIDLGSVYGVDLYKKMANSKFIINKSIDYALRAKGNLRCFESINSGAVLLSDEGDYPEGFKENVNFITYKNSDDAVRVINYYLKNYEEYEYIRLNGIKLLRENYTREIVYKKFLDLLGNL